MIDLVLKHRKLKMRISVFKSKNIKLLKYIFLKYRDKSCFSITRV